MRNPNIIHVPGLGGSGPNHRQSIWKESLPNAFFIEQENWDEPELEDWLEILDKTIKNCSYPIVLVAHSLGCALVAHWANGPKDKTCLAG